MKRLLAVGVVALGLLAVPSAAQAAFTGAVLGNSATLTGDAADDYLVVDQNSNLLRHNDLGGTFNSVLDWDSTVLGDQTVSSIDSSITIAVNGMAGNDGFVIGSASVPASALSPSFFIAGSTGVNSLHVVDLADSTGRNVTIGSAMVSGLGGPISYGEMGFATVINGTGADTDTVTGTAGGTATSVLSGDGDDTVALADGISLNGGFLNGGSGANTLDYSAWTSPFTVDLGNTVEAYASVMAAVFEDTLSTSDAFGVAQVDFTPTSATDGTFNFFGSAAGITITGSGGPRELQGSHIHAAPPGVGGGVIFDLSNPLWTGSIASLTRSITGATFPSPNIGDLRAGNTYTNLHTMAFPGGAIRGQLLRTGFAGTATGTQRIAGFGTLKTPSGTVTPSPPPAGGGTGGGGGGETSGAPPAPPLVPVPPPPVEDPARGVTLASSATVAPNGTAVIGTIANPPTVSATATLTGILPSRFAVAGRKRKPRPVTVASGQATAAAGASQRLTVRLGAKARKALKRKPIKATATVTARGTSGTTAQVKKAITLRAAKAKRKR